MVSIRQMSWIHRVTLFQILPSKRRLDAKFIHALDDAANVMAQNLRQSLIHHGNVGLAANVVAELRLYHGEGAFDVASLVVMLEELFLFQLVEVKHLRPQAFLRISRVFLEHDEGNRPLLEGNIDILFRQITLICRHFIDDKVFPCRLEQPPEQRSIRSVPVLDDDR